MAGFFKRIHGHLYQLLLKGVVVFEATQMLFFLPLIQEKRHHLLECSHGPMRIRHHDALVDIVCHALSQSHSGVLKEQRVSYEDNSRPGDVYHPIFSMVVQLILMCLFVALPSLLTFLFLLFVLG